MERWHTHSASLCGRQDQRWLAEFLPHSIGAGSRTVVVCFQLTVDICCVRILLLRVLFCSLLSYEFLSLSLSHTCIHTHTHTVCQVSTFFLLQLPSVAMRMDLTFKPESTSNTIVDMVKVSSKLKPKLDFRHKESMCSAAGTAEQMMLTR